MIFVVVLWTLVRHGRDIYASVLKKDGHYLTVAGQDSLLYCLLTPCFLLAAMTTYSTTVYPLSQPQFGGGRHNPVLLYVTDRGAKVSTLSGLPVGKNNAVGPVRILTESDREVALGLLDDDASFFNGKGSEKRAIRLNKDFIESVVPVVPKASQSRLKPETKPVTQPKQQPVTPSVTAEQRCRAKCWKAFS